MLLAACCLLVVGSRCVLCVGLVRAACCFSFVVLYMSCVGCCLMFVVRCVLLDEWCLLLIGVCCSLRAAC